MEFDLTRTRLPGAVLPEGSVWVPWHAALLDRHAAVKYASFRGEVDAQVFPSLGTAAGCRRLMREIATHKTFRPAATWLVARRTDVGEWWSGGVVRGAINAQPRPLTTRHSRRLATGMSWSGEREQRETPHHSPLTTHSPMGGDDSGPAWREFVDCGTIQGMVHSELLGSIQNVGVLPEHRGGGLGRALMLKSLDGFRELGIRRVYLEVTAENVPAVGLYQSLGFRIVRTMYKAMLVSGGVVSGEWCDQRPPTTHHSRPLVRGESWSGDREPSETTHHSPLTTHQQQQEAQ